MLPVRPGCLFRTFFLLHFLMRFGHEADWVFGVKLFPFEAHCWLAQGPAPVGDRAAIVSRYMPILVSHPVRP